MADNELSLREDPRPPSFKEAMQSLPGDLYKVLFGDYSPFPKDYEFEHGTQKAADWLQAPWRLAWHSIFNPVSGVYKGVDESLQGRNVLTDPDMMKETTGAALQLALGGKGFGEAPPGSLGMFVGKYTADPGSVMGLHNAMGKIAAGVPADVVRGNTGWFQGLDDLWRKEISDQGAGFNNHPGIIKGGPARLEEILNHPELYAHYPDLKNMVVREISDADKKEGFGGMYKYSNRSMELNTDRSDPQILSTILHEIQHAVQHEEGFLRGGVPEEFLPENYAQKKIQNDAALNPYFSKLNNERVLPYELHDALNAREQGPSSFLAHPNADYLNKVYNKASMVLSIQDMDVFRRLMNRRGVLEGQYAAALDDYRLLSGEVESRMTEQRRLWTEKERREKPVETMSSYTPAGEQIKRYPGVIYGQPPPFNYVVGKVGSGE